MVEDSLTLEYELAPAERSAISRRRSGWTWPVVAVSYLMMALIGMDSLPWWHTTFFVAAAGGVWLAPWSIIWLSTRFPSYFRASIPVSVMIDEKGIRVNSPSASKISPIRYWWSRLSEVRQDRFGIVLLFDRGWWRLVIPWKAFDDPGQQDSFLRIARNHLRDANPHEESPIPNDTLQKAS